MKNRTTIITTIILLGLLLTACNLPQPQPSEAPNVTQVEGTQQSTLDATDVPTAVPATATSSFTPTPMPAPPAGWVEYQSAELGLSLFHPADWEVIPYPELRKVDLRAPVGDGWLEISVVDAATAHTLSLTPEMLANPEAMMDALLAAFESDGEIQPAETMTSRAGYGMWTAQGIYEMMEDQLWIGLVRVNEQAVIGMGHARLDDETWDSELVPTYQDILWSVQVGQ